MKAPSLFVHRALPVIVFAVMLAGCSGPEKTGTAPSVTTSSATPTEPSTPSPTAAPPSPLTPAVDPDCVAGPGRTVQKLAAIQVPAVIVPPVTYTDKSGQQQTAV